VQVNQVTLQANQVPVQASQVLLQANQVPVQASQVLLQANQVPVQASQVPVQVNQVPVQAHLLPVQANQVPLQPAQDEPRQEMTVVMIADKNGVVRCGPCQQLEAEKEREQPRKGITTKKRHINSCTRCHHYIKAACHRGYSQSCPYTPCQSIVNCPQIP